jgi:hypothetical protein
MAGAMSDGSTHSYATGLGEAKAVSYVLKDGR